MIETTHDCALCYTFDAPERVDLNINSDSLTYGLGIIFNTNQGMSLITDGQRLIKKLSFIGIEEKTYINLVDKTHFSFEKKEDTVSFYNGNEEIVSLSFKPIEQSVTVAILLFGSGIANITF